MKLLTTILLLFCVAGLKAQLVGDKQSGLGSYYSPEYHGAETAYGAIYNKDELVAAHKAYPYNSTVRVTNEENGKSVTVRIIDKGPFIRGRIIEVSERAADALGMLGQRTVPVELTLLSTPDQRSLRQADPEPVREPAAIPPPPPEPRPVTPAPATRAASPTPAPTPTPPPAKPVTTPPKARPAPKAKTFATGLYRIGLDQVSTGSYGVQVGNYRSLESALDKVAELQGRYFDDILLHKAAQSGNSFTYKVILGPFDDQASAQNYASDLKSRYQIQGFTVALEHR